VQNIFSFLADGCYLEEAVTAFVLM